jgi:hypothetical protein
VSIWRTHIFPAGFVRKSGQIAVKPIALGYPMCQLQIYDASTEFPMAIRWMIVALTAWAFYLAGNFISGAMEGSAAGSEGQFLLYLPCVLYAAMVAGFRAIAYTSGLASPISFPGRILTGRWIIPRYDDVYLVPALIFAAGFAGPALMLQIPLPMPPMLALYFGGILAAAFFAPPTLRKRSLTAACRVIPPTAVKQFKSLYTRTNA